MHVGANRSSLYDGHNINRFVFYTLNPDFCLNGGRVHGIQMDNSRSEYFSSPTRGGVFLKRHEAILARIQENCVVKRPQPTDEAGGI